MGEKGLPKTLVNIITEDNPIPAYLFVKEKYVPGDRVMYISAKDTADDLEWLAAIDGVPAEFIEEIVLRNDIDEFKYEKICRVVKSHIRQGVHYCVNLAGGTRYMALAVQQVFEAADSEFFYTNVADNTIIHSQFDNSIFDDDDYFFPIRYRMRIAEYLTVHELEHDMAHHSHAPEMPLEAVENMFELFTKKLLSDRDYKVLELLRTHYRDCKNGIPIREVESPTRYGIPPISDIRGFLRMTNLEPHDDRLTHSQLEWLTGGWFEDYVYYKVKQIINPDEVAKGVHIWRKGVSRNNELDVVFIKNNQLFVIECKTGVQTERLFNEIVYKACALKEALLGVSCHSYIASLKHDASNDLKKIARSMDIEFWDFKIMTFKLENKLKEIKERLR